MFPSYMLKSSCSPGIASSGGDTESFVKSFCLNPSESPLHVAAKLGYPKVVSEIMEKHPVLASKLNHDGYSPLHLACWAGHGEIVSILIQASPQLCLLKDRYGRTPLYTASMKGRLGIIKELLYNCPESFAAATTAGETAIHAAVTHDQVKAVRVLLEWLKGTGYCREIVNKSDCSGDTVLHLATSRKQLQTIKYLLASPFNNQMDIVEVNAMNNSGFTALDILDVLPPRGKVDMEIEKILRRAGAVRSKDKIKAQNQKVDVSVDFRNKYHNSSPLLSTRSVSSKNGVIGDTHYALLIIATILATVTFQAALNPLGSGEEDEELTDMSIRRIPQIEKQNSYLSYLFVLFNSVTFYTSVALIIIITQEFPLKPWLLISVFALSGAYMCTVMAVSPHIAGTVLLLGGLTTLGAFSQSIALHKVVLKCLHSVHLSRKSVYPMGLV